MNMEELDILVARIDFITNFSGKANKSINFNQDEFSLRCKQYEQITKANKLSIFDAAKLVGIEYSEFITEIHIYAALNPGKVSIKYLTGYFRSGLSKQKEIDAVCWMKENNEKLTLDYLCERLNIIENQALAICKRHQLELQEDPERKKKEPIMYIDIVQNESIQKPIIKYFNENPYASAEKCIKHIGLNISKTALRNAMEYLIDKGYKIPFMVIYDPMTEEKNMADVVAYKELNPYATSRLMAPMFNTTPDRIDSMLATAAETYRIEKMRSYEFYFKHVLDEIDEIGMLCIERFMASPNSSSRWLEIKQMGLEKKIKMLGLNAPAELKIMQNIQIESKEDRDAILDAFLATENMIDVTPRGLIENA